MTLLRILIGSILIAAVATITLPAASHADGSTTLKAVYFSTSGADANDGLSPAAPKRSLKLIANLLAPDTEILLKRGDTWAVSGLTIDLKGRQGSAQARLHIGAYGDPHAPRPVIAFPAGERGSLFLLAGTRHLVVEDLDLRGGADWRAARVEAGSQIVFDRVTVSRPTPTPSVGPCESGPGITYYFSTLGSDANTGLDCDHPKRNINLIADSIPGGVRTPLLRPGVTALLKRGDVWYASDSGVGNIDLKFEGVDNAGPIGAQGPMKIGAYGTGPQPVVADMYAYPASQWSPGCPLGQNCSGLTVYRHKQQNFADQYNQVWGLYVDGVPFTRVGGAGDGPGRLLLPGAANSWCMAQEPDSLGQLGWFIYLRSSASFSNVETIQHLDDTSWGGYLLAAYPANGYGTSNLTVSDIEFRGGNGAYPIAFFAPTTNLLLQNLKVTEFKGGCIAIGVNSSGTPDQNINPQVINCTIDKGWTDAMNREHVYWTNGIDTNPSSSSGPNSHEFGTSPDSTTFNQPGGDGIALTSINGLVVRGCVITNMGHSGIGTYVDPTYVAQGVKNSLIELNEISAGTSSYCRAFAVVGLDNQVYDNTIRRNYFHDLTTGSHLGGLRVRIYSNVFNRMHKSTANVFGGNEQPANDPNWLNRFPLSALKDCLIANNVFAGAAVDLTFLVGGVQELGAPFESANQPNKIINNLFLGYRGSPDWVESGGVNPNAIYSMTEYGAFKYYLTLANNGFWPADTSLGSTVLRVNGLNNNGNDSLFTVATLPTFFPTWVTNAYLDPLLVTHSITLPAAAVRLNGPSPYATGALSIVAPDDSPGPLLPSSRASEAVDYDGIPFDAAYPSLGAFQAPIATNVLNTEYKGPRRPYINARPGLSTYVDGVSWVPGDTVRTAGQHVLSAIQSPTGGAVEWPFTIEVPTITARKTNGTVIADQGYSNTDVTVTATAYVINSVGPDGRDASRNATTIAWPSNSVFTLEGTYVTSAHGAGSVTTRFTIDKTRPVVTGVVDEGYYTTARTISFNEGVGNLDGATVTSPFTVGPSDPGFHVLTVTDLAGNVTGLSFTVFRNRTTP